MIIELTSYSIRHNEQKQFACVGRVGSPVAYPMRLAGFNLTDITFLTSVGNSIRIPALTSSCVQEQDKSSPFRKHQRADDRIVSFLFLPCNTHITPTTNK